MPQVVLDEVVSRAGHQVTEQDLMIDKVMLWIAYRLPRRLVYWCGIRLMAHATVGPYQDQHVVDLTAIDALERWEMAP